MTITGGSPSPAAAVMHHARVDHHRRSVGRSELEGGLPLVAPLAVHGAIDLSLMQLDVQVGSLSWDTTMVSSLIKVGYDPL